MFFSRLQSVLLGSLCLAALASGCWAYDAKCEACIVYHEQLFEKLCRGGVVPELVNHDDANMCELDHFWDLALNAHSDEFKSGCAFVHEAKSYRAWKGFKGRDLGCNDHDSDQILVSVKRTVCVEALDVCPDHVIPAPMDEGSRTDCEKCSAVVHRVAGYIARHEVSEVSEYRLEGLLRKKLQDERFCGVDMDRDFFDDPSTQSTEDLQEYCSDFVSNREDDVMEHFLKLREDTEAVRAALCPCGEGKEEL